VILVLLETLPFVVWEFMQTGEVYIFSHRFWPDLVARLHEPGRMRFIMQPTGAIISRCARRRERSSRRQAVFLMGTRVSINRPARITRSALASVRNLVLIKRFLLVLSFF
jgi:hypothetical protein